MLFHRLGGWLGSLFARADSGLIGRAAMMAVLLAGACWLGLTGHRGVADLGRRAGIVAMLMLLLSPARL